MQEPVARLSNNALYRKKNLILRSAPFSVELSVQLFTCSTNQCPAPCLIYQSKTSQSEEIKCLMSGCAKFLFHSVWCKTLLDSPNSFFNGDTQHLTIKLPLLQRLRRVTSRRQT